MPSHVRQHKSPYFYVQKGSGFVLLDNHEETQTRYKTEAEAKKAVLSLNDAWRAKHGTRVTPSKSNPLKFKEGRDPSGMYKLSDLKKGEFFKRKPTARKVYTKGDYDRGSKKYGCGDYEAAGDEIFLTGDTMVYVGFDY